jgi:release factor glutamine methyltransferase
MPTLKALLAQGRERLAAAGVAAPALDARLLLQHVLQWEASALIAEGDSAASAALQQHYLELVERRAAREPVSKITGFREFYGRLFHVSADVLDPRADSETLIELALHLGDGAPRRVLDLGTGSGVLLLTLLAERTGWRGVGVDLSHDALAIARQNASALGLHERFMFLHGNWFEGVSGSFDLIISNPPYIESAVVPTLEPEVFRHDPLLALDGGPDGLEAYRAIARGAAAQLAEGGHVLVEIGAGQAADVLGIFGCHGLVLAGERHDLSGTMRVLAFNRP